jgi:mannosyl-oligosaccharide alpha-1,2-mannosidase
MESFLLAETFKYALLLFSDVEVLSLHDWVFSTEAHAFRIHKQKGAGVDVEARAQATGR